MVPQKAMEQELKSQEKELTDDINGLNKKVASAFYADPNRLKCTPSLSQSFSRSSSMMPKLSYVTS
jgi:hypothetical protein